MTELDGRAVTIQELLANPIIKEKVENFVNALDVLTMLIAAGYVKPLLPLENEAECHWVIVYLPSLELIDLNIRQS